MPFSIFTVIVAVPAEQALELRREREVGLVGLDRRVQHGDLEGDVERIERGRPLHQEQSASGQPRRDPKSARAACRAHRRPEQPARVTVRSLTVSTVVGRQTSSSSKCRGAVLEREAIERDAPGAVGRAAAAGAAAGSRLRAGADRRGLSAPDAPPCLRLLGGMVTTSSLPSGSRVMRASSPSISSVVEHHRAGHQVRLGDGERQLGQLERSARAPRAGPARRRRSAPSRSRGHREVGGALVPGEIRRRAPAERGPGPHRGDPDSTARRD